MASTRNIHNRQWFVYVLKCPTSGEVRYVGWTFDVRTRLMDHKSSARRKRCYRDCWIRSLMRQGLFPDHEVIETGDGSWAEAERKWIRFYREAGAKLTNLTDGGEGVPGLRLSAESIESMRQKKIGRKQTPEVIARRSEAMRGHVCSLETRMKISVANTGKKRTAEARRRMSLANKGKTISEETRRKISETNTGMKRPFKRRGPPSAETRRKIGAANKLAYANKENKSRGPFSEETKQKMREASIRSRLTRALDIFSEFWK